MAWLKGLKTKVCWLIDMVKDMEEAAKPGVSDAMSKISKDCGDSTGGVVPAKCSEEPSKLIHAGSGV